MDEKKHPVEKKSFTLRTMEIKDLAEVYKLGEQSFKADLYPMLYRSWDEYEVTTLFNTDGDYCLVAENDADEGENICGFVLGTVVSKTGSAWSYGYIIWLAVHPNWQREGVASKLVDKIVEIMIAEEGIRIMMADTDPENVRAVRFFQNKGFEDSKAHLYLSTNLEHNPLYSDLLRESRAEARDATLLKKRRKAALSRKQISKKLLTKKSTQKLSEMDAQTLSAISEKPSAVAPVKIRKRKKKKDKVKVKSSRKKTRKSKR